MIGADHAWPAGLAAFLASFVEAVEALTVVLAVGMARGWRGALVGTAAGLALLALLVVLLGPALTAIPLGMLQLVVGALLLLFGLRWLRKAVLRAAGVIPLHDEAAIYARRVTALGGAGRPPGLDRVGIATAFEIVMLEGLEVVFIVVAVGAGGAGLLLPAGIGAVGAILVVMLLGAIVHRPLARVPENALKFVVGVLLSAFGLFWTGEGLGIGWPGADWSIPGLIAGFAATAAIGVALARAVRPARGGAA